MAGDARQVVYVERRPRQPFGMAFDRLGIFVTLGALAVDVATGHRQQRLCCMRLMAIRASGVLAVRALLVFGKDRGVTILAFCPRRPDAVRRMTLRYIVMTGNAPDLCMRRQFIFRRIDIEMRPLADDRLFTVAGHTRVRHGTLP